MKTRTYRKFGLFLFALWLIARGLMGFYEIPGLSMMMSVVAIGAGVFMLLEWSR